MAVAHTPTDLFVRLNELGIPTTTLEHAAAFTVEELEAAAGHVPGVHVKNLFLCDAKKKMWLVVAPSDMRIDLKNSQASWARRGCRLDRLTGLRAFLPSHPDR
jgi:hypothetical protein